jgi:CRP-like cAMP-binding protein
MHSDALIPDIANIVFINILSNVKLALISLWSLYMHSKTFDIFFKFFKQLGIEDGVINKVGSELKFMALEPSQVLLYQGEPQKYGYLIVSGVLRACYFSNAGNERCKEYYFQGEMTFLYSAWLTNTPANYQIDTLNKSEVIRIPLAILNSSNWQSAKLNLLQQQLLYKEEKEVFLLLKNPEERYIHMVKHAPKWLNSLNDIQLSAYIGISPISLSRIKNRIKKHHFNDVINLS